MTLNYCINLYISTSPPLGVLELPQMGLRQGHKTTACHGPRCKYENGTSRTTQNYRIVLGYDIAGTSAFGVSSKATVNCDGTSMVTTKYGNYAGREKYCRPCSSFTLMFFRANAEAEPREATFYSAFLLSFRVRTQSSATTVNHNTTLVVNAWELLSSTGMFETTRKLAQMNQNR